MKGEILDIFDVKDLIRTYHLASLRSLSDVLIKGEILDIEGGERNER